MKLVLLPGMDGTGILFEPLSAQLGEEWDVEIVTYPNEGSQDYDTLKRHTLSCLPENEDYILVGESFSGPIAYSIGMATPRSLKAIIFVATFLESPRPKMLRLVQPLFQVFGGLRPPNTLIRHWLLGENATEELVERFKSALRSVPKSIIAKRLGSVTTFRPPTKALTISSAYIQAARDRLVPDTCLNKFLELIPGIRIYKINGPHFILQSQVSECIEVLKKEKALLTTS